MKKKLELLALRLFFYILLLGLIIIGTMVVLNYQSQGKEQYWWQKTE